MATITLGTLRDYWKAVSDWVTGASTSTPSVQLTGSFATIKSAPITGIKTVTATAAEIFAGTSALSGRRKMILKMKTPFFDLELGFNSNTTEWFSCRAGSGIGNRLRPGGAGADICDKRRCRSTSSRIRVLRRDKDDAQYNRFG